MTLGGGRTRIILDRGVSDGKTIVWGATYRVSYN